MLTQILKLSIFLTWRLCYNLQMSWRDWAPKARSFWHIGKDRHGDLQSTVWTMYTRQPVDMQTALICVFSERRLPHCLCSPLTCLCLQQNAFALSALQSKNFSKILLPPAEYSFCTGFWRLKPQRWTSTKRSRSTTWGPIWTKKKKKDILLSFHVTSEICIKCPLVLVPYYTRLTYIRQWKQRVQCHSRAFSYEQMRTWSWRWQ